MADEFVHLHVHTEYSLLDGAARLGDLFDEVTRQGAPAVAMTDHGNLHGAHDFYSRAMKAGVKPIIGMEAYVAPGRRGDTERVQWGTPEQKRYDVSGRGAYTHMTMWAENKTGLHNLMKLSSRAYSEGLLGKHPRIDAELLAEHAEGIIGTTGCPGGEVMTRLNLGQYREAVEAAAKYRDILGQGNYFLELMDHGIEIERRVRDGLLRLGRELHLPFVVTNDSHYVRAEDSVAHDALLCVQTGSELGNPNRFRFEGSGYYLRTAEEMYGLDHSHAWNLGCRNTMLIAEMVDPSGMFEAHDLMPRFPVPATYTEAHWFRKEVAEGMGRRYPNGTDDAHWDQVKYECEMINQMGFPSYFLVVADFINWAKAQGIAVGPGRGSAAGSLVAYALGITDLDPLEHGLIFERFLNPERVQMPDIDIDFDDRRRHEVIRYVTEKYGADKVSMIGTFGRIKAKAAIKDAARVLGKPFAVGDRITKALPPDVMGASAPLAVITDPEAPRYDEAGEVRAMYGSSPEVREVVDTATGLEGLVRQMGVHAAGVIMSSETITDHVPVWVRPADGVTVTQFDYPQCESLGLLKMDFLGLRNLTIMSDAVKNIAENRGEVIDLDTIPMDDRATYELLARGDTLSVFQLDGGPMRSLLRLLRPDNFEDISAVVALYRPGPMGVNSHTNYALRKNGQQEIEPIHPELAEPLAEILGPTFGLIIYQEQVQRAAQILAGYSLGQADLLRRAMGKKKKEILDKEFVTFEAGCKANGYSDEAIRAVWDVLVPFAGYAFNKAHSAAYGLIAYRTAYLKTHYPAEYMAAVLTSVGDDRAKMATYLAECKRMGLKVKAPDVSVSNASFTPNGEREIRFGLAAVKNVGEGIVEAIIKSREIDQVGGVTGAFSSMASFLAWTPEVAANKKAVESLIKAGAFDSMGVKRGSLAEVYESVTEAVKSFNMVYQDPPRLYVPPGTPAVELSGRSGWDRHHVLTAEREMLGLYVSDHPLAGLGDMLASRSTHTVADLLDEGTHEGMDVTVGGLVAAVERKTSKRGGRWAIVTLEDLTGQIEVLFFPGQYDQVEAELVQDAVLFVSGRLERREGAPQIIGGAVSRPRASDYEATPAAQEPEQSVLVQLPARRFTERVAGALAELLGSYPGKLGVELHLHGEARVERMHIGRFRVNDSVALRAELDQFAEAVAEGYL
ncbi:DNA polymerase III subunit alpha [Streptomyces smyrnaeus]|uniref:DNA polymerase III subunit alpha n=1 Tax=Streptomyces smyrnaeus TaxID=1387713 RepID=UPI0033B8C47C